MVLIRTGAVIITTVKPQLNKLIERAIHQYEVEQQKRIFVNVRQRYTLAFYKFFLDVFQRLEDAKFLDSFYGQVTNLYVETDSNLDFTSEIIKYFVKLIEQDTVISYELVYYGQKNSFNLIINYTLNVLRSKYELIKIDSAKLLRLVNYYQKHVYDSAPRVGILKTSATTPTISRFLKKRFFDLHKEKVYYIGSRFVAEINKINKVVSDSARNQKSKFFSMPISHEVLLQSWGGDGDSIYDSCRKLDTLASLFGGTEDGQSSNMEFANKYLRLLKTSSFGSNELYKDFAIGREDYFGQFNRIFTVGEQNDIEIWGLGFLEPLTKTKSFQSISPGVDPVRAMFANGIRNRLSKNEKLGRKTETSLASISVYLVSLLKRANNIGWSLLSIENSLDSNSRLRGYEGLGSLKYPVKSLREIFPVSFQTYDIKEIGGITGAFEHLTEGIIGIQNHLEEGSLPSKSLESLVPWINEIKNKLEIIVSTIETVGYKQGDIIPNIPLRVSARTRSDFELYFKRHGYNDNDIEKILSSKNILDLLSNFQDRITSRDIKSFAGSYDLTALVYAISGEAGVRSVLEYLYQPDSNGFARIYGFLEKYQSKFLKLDSYKYGKLLGALYSILELSNPEDIKALSSYLKAKNSTIGESLKIVSETDAPINLLKTIEETNLIENLISLSADGHTRSRSAVADMNYQQALENSPFELKYWTGLVEKSSGFANKEKLLLMFDQARGVTYKELISVLRLDVNPGISVLSGILDGARGGEFTRIVRDFYASGLSILSRNVSFRNSNSVVTENDFYLVDFVENLKNFITDLELLNYRLLLSTEENRVNREVSSRDSSLITKSIINSVNKPLEVVAKLTESLTVDSEGNSPYRYNQVDIQRILEEAGLSEPPGIGNSPRIPRRFKQNTLTPELATRISGDVTPSSLISKFGRGEQTFFKIIPQEKYYDWEPSRFTRKLLEATAFSDPTIAPESFVSSGTQQAIIPSISELDVVRLNDQGRMEIQPSGAPVFSTNVTQPVFKPDSDYTKSLLTYPIDSVVKDSYVSNIPGEATDISQFQPYDPVQSCLEFGSSNAKCQEWFKDYERVECKEYSYNRSSLIEDNTIQTPSSNGSIPVDRPLGVSTAPNPSSSFVPNFYKNPPNYLLNTWQSPDALNEYGEPIGGSRREEFDSADFSNTSIALKEYVTKHGYPTDEQDCSRKNDDYDLQKCLNVLLCRRSQENNRPRYCLGLYADA